MSLRLPDADSPVPAPPLGRTGAFARRLGLALEAVCLLSLMALNQRPDAGPLWAFTGFDLKSALTAGLGVGFLLWLYGTFELIRGQARARIRRGTGRDVL